MSAFHVRVGAVRGALDLGDAGEEDRQPMQQAGVQMTNAVILVLGGCCYRHHHRRPRDSEQEQQGDRRDEQSSEEHPLLFGEALGLGDDYWTSEDRLKIVPPILPLVLQRVSASPGQRPQPLPEAVGAVVEASVAVG